MTPVSTPLMLRSEAIARRETGVLPNALWPRVSEHDPEDATPLAYSGPLFEARLWRSLGHIPREACMLRAPTSMRGAR